MILNEILQVGNTIEIILRPRCINFLCLSWDDNEDKYLEPPIIGKVLETSSSSFIKFKVDKTNDIVRIPKNYLISKFHRDKLILISTEPKQMELFQ